MIWGDDADPVKRWRAEMDQLDRERTEAKEQMKRSEECRERDVARAGACEEISELRDNVKTLFDLLRDITDATNQTFTTLANEASARREDIADLKLQIARLSASPEAKRAFQFAREKSDGEIVDLPDFIRKMH